ncbi:MAG: ATP-dependent DNA helicase RecG [Gammaproteobacteria bacterium 39-13]|nr:ATP-dependent DNA helicase RecG [Gammaproteobacteria bacterium]OJV90604.1 MAG: ATP-dependent DNA helicase RecG [Gammaproteobacteria bacterium 39-13]
MLKGVGAKIAEKLEKLQIFSMGDLLLHCPFRYENRTQLTPISYLIPEQFAVVQGKIIDVKIVKARKKRCLITIVDKTGALQLLFFHFHAKQQEIWKVDMILRCFGQIKAGTRGLQIVHPEMEIIDKNQPMPSHLTPVYPTVAGLSQFWLRRTIYSLLDQYTERFKGQEDIFANQLSTLRPMLPWIESLNVIHRPLPEVDQEALIQRTHPAFSRLISEELICHHLSLQKIRQQAKARQATSLNVDESLLDAFLKNLPFALTSAQQHVWQDIRRDVALITPMLRLIQGDVGCGKTVVAALAAVAALSAGKQVAIMAPTEILAEQHYHQFNQWFLSLNFRCEFLSSKLKAKAKRNALENITLGLANIVIGTQALFQDDVQFNALGLIIIDEQHRFGVHQRLSLQIKGTTSLNPTCPHQLIMTATPIPRTLAMSHYAHLDISVIDGLPPGRQTITTLTIPQSRRDEIIERMNAVCERGQQVYWVCTLIEESDVLQCQAAEVAAQELQALVSHRVGLVHGRMETSEKESIMQAFYAGEISILVATTVIEVGVNVPNATLMVIENPERLGLAQLHQLRGRVGRGSEQSFCVLLYSAPLSEMAQSRLKIMRETADGFVIAEADLALRGPGEVLGVRQTGALQFKVADLVRDEEIVRAIPSWADKISHLSVPLLERMIQRWGFGGEYGQA